MEECKTKPQYKMGHAIRFDDSLDQPLNISIKSIISSNLITLLKRKKKCNI